MSELKMGKNEMYIWNHLVHKIEKLLTTKV